MRKLLHEIRTPCHVVCGLLASLRDELRNPSRSVRDKVEAAMADTLGASMQMQLLNEKIVDASDAQFFQDGKVPKLQSSSFDLQAALVALFENLERRRPSSKQGPGLRRVFKFGGSEVAWTDLIEEPALWPHQMPRMFVGDEAKLMRVISRLLDNALKACNEGEVCLEVKAWGTSDDQPYRLTFNVVDTGPGISTGEDVNSYFHSGCRYRNFSLMDEELLISRLEEKELVADTEGMGLGLFIAFHLTEILGGELQYVRSSDCGRGSAETWFHFTVPLAREENSQQDFVLAAGPTQAGGVSRSPSDDLTGVWMDAADSSQGLKHVDFGAVSQPIEGRAPAVGLMNELRRKPHVLIVDDMTICLKVAVKMMGSLGCTCDTASNGDEALEVLRKAPTSFDMVLMDLRMPVMDGIEATARLRQDEMLADLPVVAFTAEELETEGVLGMGFDSMVRKPATKASLSAVLSELVLDVVDPGLRPPRSTRLQGLRSGIASRSPSEGRNKKMHALLVEDNSVCQKVAATMLSRLGFKVTTANHGVECLDLLRVHSDFDVILMDLHMPVMGGAEATRALRERGHEKIPVIALSAETWQDKDTRELFAAVVNKPCNLPALKMVLSELRVLPSASG
jgi:CheY-like chemotaxis protein